MPGWSPAMPPRRSQGSRSNREEHLAVGGAGLASTFIKLGLIDEYRLFVSPVVLGGGTPFFPALDERIGLELVETRTFGSRVVYVRYQHVEDGR